MITNLYRDQTQQNMYIPFFEVMNHMYTSSKYAMMLSIEECEKVGGHRLNESASGLYGWKKKQLFFLD